MKTLKYSLMFSGLYVLLMSALLLGGGEAFQSSSGVKMFKVQKTEVEKPAPTFVAVENVTELKKEKLAASFDYTLTPLGGLVQGELPGELTQEAAQGQEEEGQASKKAVVVPKVKEPSFDKKDAGGTFTTYQKGPVGMEVFDQEGNSILRRDWKVDAGSYKFHLRTDFIVPGMYSLVLQCDGKPYLHRFSKD